MMSETILDRIVAATRADLNERRDRVPVERLREQAASMAPARPFAATLRPAPGGSARLIAEVKRASPSKGLIAETFDPVAQALAYEAGGAAAISVLTEPHFFLGSLAYLSAVRERVSVPVLRKDFIIDPYQIYEARAAGADAVLLICALLDAPTLRDLLALTHHLGMEALVEAHDREETLQAVDCGALVVGVNSRDLRAFTVNTDIVRHLRPLVPRDRVFVAESGITDALGAARARAWGADAVLVGESLMRASDATEKTHELSTAPGGGTASLYGACVEGRVFVKLCGLTTRAQAELAVEVGANAVGLVFYPPSHRNVAPDQALALADVTSEAGLLATGVFVNETLDTVAHIQRQARLSALQLSGDETPAYCAELVGRVHVPVLKALRLRAETDLDLLDEYALANVTLLLDAHVPGGYGGAGRTGDWRLARRAAERWPIILSGGLTPENVASAIAQVGPRGVDVSSGIETNKVKDPEKIRAFMKAVEAATQMEASAIS